MQQVRRPDGLGAAGTPYRRPLLAAFQHGGQGRQRIDAGGRHRLPRRIEHRPAAAHRQVQVADTESLVQQPRRRAVRQGLVEQRKVAGDPSRRRRAHAVGMGRLADVALGVEALSKIGMQGIAGEAQPAVQRGATRSMHGRAEYRVAVHQVKQDGGGLVQHRLAVGEHRQQALRVEGQEGRGTLLPGGAVHRHRAVVGAGFFQRHAHHQVGAVGGVVQAQGHGRFSAAGSGTGRCRRRRRVRNPTSSTLVE